MRAATVDATEAAVIPFGEELKIPVEEELKRVAEKFRVEFSKREAKIHRIPAIMRDLTNHGMGHYFIPKTVAIGPYHHGARHLRETEELKRAAAYYFCTDSGHSVEYVYRKMLSVVDDARSCYEDDTVAGISDAEFASMMFHDGCFLLQCVLYVTDGDKVNPSLKSWFSCMLNIPWDIFLLENQIPRLVLQAFMDMMPVLGLAARVCKFIARIARFFNIIFHEDADGPNFRLDGSFTWPHLLGFLRCYISGIMSNEEVNQYPQKVTPFAVTSSVIELEEIGIKLTSSRRTKLKDMGIKKGPLFSQLYLVPFVMNNITARLLVNMAGLEVCIFDEMDPNCSPVLSYISILAMLVNREEDVHELRAKGLLHGKFSDQEMLQLFKTLVKHINVGAHYIRILQELEDYKRKRRLCIIIHKFVYNNIKTIVTVLSAIGVLVGIFKALLSIKQHQQ